MSLLNTDMKIIIKVLSTAIKNVLTFLISSNQTAYVKHRFIGDSGKAISDILEIANTLALGFLVTIDIENQCFLLEILWKFGFGIDFVSCIKTIFKNQESCVLNSGKKTTKYFKLERGVWQGDPIFCVFVYTGVRNIFSIF